MAAATREKVPDYPFAGEISITAPTQWVFAPSFPDLPPWLPQPATVLFLAFIGHSECFLNGFSAYVVCECLEQLKLFSWIPTRSEQLLR